MTIFGQHQASKPEPVASPGSPTSTDSNGTSTQHHTGGRLRAAALRLRHRLNPHASAKQQDPLAAALPSVPETRQLSQRQVIARTLRKAVHTMTQGVT